MYSTSKKCFVEEENFVIAFCQPRNMIECQIFHDIIFVILPLIATTVVDESQKTSFEKHSVVW